ncbi:hypothetical protein [Jiangella alkaliphila]|uniref:Lipoprotein n=1 Tax=Jiangella alkaliphila TaxID=419479 RepID=A0A1H2L8H4_9ACTN|nr:hypothetical protein [Jiangella alkaliphila]SDU77134.1 hypothetical protein SAMN04488563_5430 [Jiangella alkaliphila]
MEMSSRPQRLCFRCTGAALAVQVLYGCVVTVTAIAGQQCDNGHEQIRAPLILSRP